MPYILQAKGAAGHAASVTKAAAQQGLTAAEAAAATAKRTAEEAAAQLQRRGVSVRDAAIHAAQSGGAAAVHAAQSGGSAAVHAAQSGGAAAVHAAQSGGAAARDAAVHAAQAGAQKVRMEKRPSLPLYMHTTCCSHRAQYGKSAVCITRARGWLDTAHERSDRQQASGLAGEEQGHQCGAWVAAGVPGCDIAGTPSWLFSICALPLLVSELQARSARCKRYQQTVQTCDRMAD